MTQHTPGPWRAVVRSNQHGLQVAAVDMPPHTSWRPSKQRPHAVPDYEAANARLIAAAPDLLAAIEMLYHQGYADDTPVWKNAVKVVRAAKGLDPLDEMLPF